MLNIYGTATLGVSIFLHAARSGAQCHIKSPVQARSAERIFFILCLQIASFLLRKIGEIFRNFLRPLRLFFIFFRNFVTPQNLFFHNERVLPVQYYTK